MEPKKKMGRPSQGKVGRRYTLNKEVVEYLDSLPDGERSRFVDEAVAKEIKKVKAHEYRQLSQFNVGDTIYRWKDESDLLVIRIDRENDQVTLFYMDNGIEKFIKGHQEQEYPTRK